MRHHLMIVILATAIAGGGASAAVPAPCKSVTCATLSGVADGNRASAYADLSKDWTAPRRASFEHLLIAQEAFAKAVGANEIDHAGAESDADALLAQHAETSAFQHMLKTLVHGTPRLSFVEFAETDSGLNATYEQVMAVRETSDLAWGSVEKSGIARTQRAWLAYRDAFVAFAATIDPDAAVALKGELTTRRTVSLEGFLAD